MINVIFNDFNYEILPKRLETYDKYCKILQWGRANPTRFLETFMNLQFTDHQKWILLSSWTPSVCVWLCSRSSGKSFMLAPLMMARSLLLPNTNTYIMAPSGSQSQETFTKLENLAKNNIASALGVSSFFLDETVKFNSKADPFTHDKNSYSVSLYNGSTINTLNSVAKHIVGIRSNFSAYDEAGKIDREFYALTLPFSVQDTNFVLGGSLNTDLYPEQLPNKNLFLSSAEGIDSELFDRYKICFEKMMVGDPDYFVCDIDCSFSLHPFLNGKPTKPLIKQSEVDDAFKVNPYKATREYYNKFDNDAGEDVFLKRSVIRKCCQPYYPTHKNETKTSKYIISYDPSTKLDNSIIMVAELIRDEEKGLMVKFVNCINLVDILPNGEKAVMQKPQQMEKIKDLILDYNLGAVDYENIDQIIIDAGAGGGGTDIAQFLMSPWEGKDGKFHLGFIDVEDPYMKLREDDYLGNARNLKLFNFKRQKETAYTRVQNCINQGLCIFPDSPNARNELEIEVKNEDGTVSIRYEKIPKKDLSALVQFDLTKEELGAFQKIKKPNNTIVYSLSPDAVQRNFHDDRADCVAMILNRLMELRAQEALETEEKSTDYKKLFKEQRARYNKKYSNFNLANKPNPFLEKQRPNLFR